MGFRNGAFATVWEVTPISDTQTKLRISTSRKNKKTGSYEQDFSGFVLCVGSVAAASALKLKESSRIKLGDCDVTTRYDPQKKISYTNFALFSFEPIDSSPQKKKEDPAEPQPTVDDGEPETDDRLPF